MQADYTPALCRLAFTVDGEPLTRSSKVRMTGTQDGMENYEFPAGSYSLEVALVQP